MTPLIIVAFNRPQKLRRVIDAVKAQTRKPDKVIGILDGPRNPEEAKSVAECKRELETIADHVYYRDQNYGCAANIMRGIAAVTREHERFALLEDDTLPANHWYESITKLLDHYESEPTIGAVGSFPSVLTGSLKGYPSDVVLSPRFSCWGWGSWSAKWQRIDNIWLQYKANGAFPSNISELPDHAGSDIAGMLRNCPPGFLWDAVVAGAFLKFGLLQAITRYYLTRNIGADVHLPESKIQFMWSHNLIEERVPQTFPPVEFNGDVAAAVRAYVHAMS